MHRMPGLRAVALWITVAARMGEQWVERMRGVDFIQHTMDEVRR